MSESQEAFIARLDERLKTMFELQKEMSEGQNQHTIRMINLENRMGNVESSLLSNKPVIDEFITIKTKVVGAGQFGKYIWVGAASIISFLIGARSEIIGWLTKS